jgi:hypothetical protein
MIVHKTCGQADAFYRVEVVTQYIPIADVKAFHGRIVGNDDLDRRTITLAEGKPVEGRFYCGNCDEDFDALDIRDVK